MDWQTVFIVIGGAAFSILVAWCRWLSAKVGELAEDLGDYKLAVAKEYASIAHLNAVEHRLVAELHTMNRNLTRLNDSVNRMLGARGVGPLSFSDDQG